MASRHVGVGIKASRPCGPRRSTPLRPLVGCAVLRWPDWLAGGRSAAAVRLHCWRSKRSWPPGAGRGGLRRWAAAEAWIGRRDVAYRAAPQPCWTLRLPCLRPNVRGGVEGGAGQRRRPRSRGTPRPRHRASPAEARGRADEGVRLGGLDPYPGGRLRALVRIRLPRAHRGRYHHAQPRLSERPPPHRMLTGDGRAPTVG